MRIDNIHIRNFRGFEDRIFDLDPQATVIVGNNTTGKTSLLKALQVALGSYLKTLSSLPSGKLYRMNFTKDDVFKRYIPEKKDFFVNPHPTSIDVEGKIFLTEKDGSDYRPQPVDVEWTRIYKGGQTVDINNKLAGYVSKMEMDKMRTGHNSIFPVILSFGVKRIDNDYSGSKKRGKRESGQERAYRSALLDTVDFKSAFDWIYNYDSMLAKGYEFKGTDKAFLNALETAIPALSEIEINPKNQELIAKVSVTGQPAQYQTYDHMSDGFKSMICIVAEIAYKCIQLNGFLGEEAVMKTPGVVMIDEVDLYLHPRWQSHILADLRKAFPLIQFIVSSHSPFVIQSVEPCNLVVLDAKVGDGFNPKMSSIEEIILAVMNMDTVRSTEYNEMLEKAQEFYDLVNSGDMEKAREAMKLLKKLESKFSNNPAYVALLSSEKGKIQ